MKTIFKVGQEVYDQVYFPDKKGKVVEIQEDESECPLVVCFNENMRIRHYYDLQGCYTKYKQPALSTKPYKMELVGFEQKEPVITYDEVIRESFRKGERVTILDKIELPNERIRKAFEALAKLIWLRDYYNEGWQPDFEDDEWKYIIENYRGEIGIERTCGNSKILAFKSKEIRDKFLEEQRELLEIAKPLL